MAKYDNSGSLSKNERKEKETHADYKGKATVNGVEYWISAWVKENERGKWLSLAFEPKEDRPSCSDRRQTPRADDDLPPF